ncbi:MAG: radical SAM protein [Candidatus Helarchaeota archaeon]|nr:radical SAM protein [Candidatus Helarchaeota archaeon]
MRLKEPFKIVKSTGYNYIFNMKNGFFVRWGKSKDDDPPFSPFGPELLDIEVSTICHGGCEWCYKSNKKEGKKMTFNTFKKVLDKVPPILTQVAFGVGDLDANPDLWKMFEYCRQKMVIPNITINGNDINGDLAKKLTKNCGAVAVSHYNDDKCFNAVKLLTDKGLKHVNIHKLVCGETEKDCYALFEKCKSDLRLKRLNAILLLSLKRKGRGVKFHALESSRFSRLVNYALRNKISIGFDSCSTHNLLKAVKDNDNYETFNLMVEPCESSCFSYYINVEGIGYPCSFLEGENGYRGINIKEIPDFLKDAWYHDFTVNFRNKLLKNNRICPQFKI